MIEILEYILLHFQEYFLPYQNLLENIPTLLRGWKSYFTALGRKSNFTALGWKSNFTALGWKSNFTALGRKSNFTALGWKSKFLPIC